MRIFIVDAFTQTPGSGNRAGVLVEAGALDEARMQRTAAAIGASETAFVLGIDNRTVKLRYFTPAAEIDFCGHATVATFHLLAELGKVDPTGRYTLDCKAGKFEIELEKFGRAPLVWVVTPQYEWTASPLPPERLAALLGTTTEAFDPSLPILKSGHKLFVPFHRRWDVWALSPRYEELKLEARPTGVWGVMCFTRDALDQPNAVHGRYFTPAFGILEDPATGSAQGPLAAYLVHHGVLTVPADGVVRARSEQGDAMGKPSRIELEVTGKDRTVERARMGGFAVTVLEGELRG